MPKVKGSQGITRSILNGPYLATIAQKLKSQYRKLLMVKQMLGTWLICLVFVILAVISKVRTDNTWVA
jgi:hypothetical protein